MNNTKYKIISTKNTIKFLSLLIAFLIIINTLSSSVSAFENTMSLLAVKDTKKGLEGSLAKLDLEIIPGKGRVLLETSPLTKIDTQASTRIAKEIACDYLKIDCSNLDFIYTIKSESSIIGGPSAGAAMSVITIATLKKTKLNSSVVMTGTINSGNIIGPVGGVKEKIDIAEKSNFKKIIIPFGEKIFLNKNKSINPKEYQKNKTILIEEAMTLDIALKSFIGGENKNLTNHSFTIDEEYISIMKKISNELCKRTDELIILIPNKTKNEFLNDSKKSKTLIKNKEYYSGASICFTNNINIQKKINENISRAELNKSIQSLNKKIKKFDVKIDSIKRKTIPQLQTYIIVKERINDAQENNKLAQTALLEKKDKLASEYYAYALERYYSSKVWSLFFNKKGKQLNLNKKILSTMCFKKIQEAESRIQYLRSLFPGLQTDLEKKMNLAKYNYHSGQYELCLNYASLAKANADSILGGTAYFNKTELKNLILVKLNITQSIISNQQEKGLFPILGYSYYEYSKNLINTSIYSSLLFSQYALELSDFNIYIKGQQLNKINITQKHKNKSRSTYDFIIVYLVGIVTGGIILYLFKQ